MGELSDKKIRSSNEPGRYSDGDGLYLIVKESGRKSWMLRTMVQGKRSDIGLGGYPTVKLVEAREEAARIRKIAKNGGNPLAERKKQALRFEDAVRAYYATIKDGMTSARHAAQWIKSFESDLFKSLGTRPIAELSSADFLRVLTPLWTKKPVAAKKLRQRIAAVFEWAFHAGHYPHANPVAGIDRALPKTAKDVNHFAAMDWRELPKYYASIEDALVKFLMLTAVRSSEGRCAKWEEFDFVDMIWTIPAERMKMRKEHRVPLTEAMKALIEPQLKLRSDYVFPSKRKRGLEPVAVNHAIRIVADSGATVHGFRSSFKDWCDESAHADHRVSEAALAHETGSKTVRAYARSDFFERRRELMQQWSDYVTGVLGNKNAAEESSAEIEHDRFEMA